MTSLNAQGLTVSDLKKKLNDQLKAKFTVDMEVRQKVFINPQDVTTYFNGHADEFVRKPSINLQSVYISYDQGVQDARSRAMEARSRLMAGEDFDKLFKEYSQLPSVGIIEKGQMISTIEDKVFSLKIDEVSDLVEVEGGVYVFKAIGINPGRKQTLEEVKDKVYNKLLDIQFQDRFKEWIEKLRKKAYVEVKE